MENIDSINISHVPEQKSPEIKYAPHLKEGVKPIIAGLGTPEQFQQYPGKELEIENAHNTRNVDFDGSPWDFEKQGFKYGGTYTYVISTVDGLDKLSRHIEDCTGMVAVGQDKETGENISFLSHEWPGYILRGEQNKNTFINDLQQSLKELQVRSVDQTIDVVILGGNYSKRYEQSKKDYSGSIGLLSEQVKQVLGFEPLVIVGPKNKEREEEDDVFFDNKNRRIYIKRPRVSKSTTESFYPSELESRMKEWDKEVK